MSHILVMNSSAWGHVLPTLDVTAELVRRGHRVTYVTGNGPVKHVRATGATVVEYDGEMHEVDFTKINSARSEPWAPLVMVRECTAILAAVEAHFGSDRPDLILYENGITFAGRILARKWNLPAVFCSAFLMSNRHFSLMEHLRGVREAAGVKHRRQPHALKVFRRELMKLVVAHGQSNLPLTDFEIPEPVNLGFFPKSFQLMGETFDDTYHFIGPAVEGGNAAGEWTPPGDGKPVLTFSLGTSHFPRPGFYRTCLDAFAAMPWHVVLVVYEGIDEAELNPLPPNVEIHRWVPLFSVLRRSELFVCHAGMGSLMSAMYCGTPVVTVPHSPEATANANRIQELGLGRVLDAETLTAEQLRDAVLEVSADPDIPGRVAAMRADILAAGGGARGADVIEEHLAGVSGQLADAGHP